MACLKNSMANASKFLNSMKGSKIEWNSVMEAKRKLPQPILSVLSSLAAVEAFCVKREVLETVKFGSLDKLGPLLDVAGSELCSLVSEDHQIVLSPGKRCDGTLDCRLAR